MGRKGRDGMEYSNKMEWVSPPPAFAERKTAIRLNDYSEVTVGGVVYRVSSVFAGKGQLGDLLDLVAMEKISRIA